MAAAVLSGLPVALGPDVEGELFAGGADEGGAVIGLAGVEERVGAAEAEELVAGEFLLAEPAGEVATIVGGEAQQQVGGGEAVGLDGAPAGHGELLSFGRGLRGDGDGVHHVNRLLRSLGAEQLLAGDVGLGVRQVGLETSKVVKIGDVRLEM